MVFNTCNGSDKISVKQTIRLPCSRNGGNADVLSNPDERREHFHSDRQQQDQPKERRRKHMENILAENIRSYRKGLGLTQEQLAERLGITLGAVSKWERGSSEPDLSYIMDLAGIFHVSVDALVEGHLYRQKLKIDDCSRKKRASKTKKCKNRGPKPSKHHTFGAPLVKTLSDLCDIYCFCCIWADPVLNYPSKNLIRRGK